MAVDPLPSDAELRILQALWEQPGASVHDVHDWICTHERALSYTTVLTQLQRMHKKGLVKRGRDGLQHRYSSVPTRSEVEAKLIHRLSNKAFDGSAVRLALKALGTDQPTGEELDELQRWLDAQKDQHD
ncbi:putative transcriptional regulator [Neolewinella xylanilytica]|uniref:Putative transcriptional regulator n=1 Tax=Neolewinella xylanilytica TaxID=1514080 RepID=A0A2S6I9I0_9BACT|nr:BlaI/MecI/CopY family transcriptional regulator [Neolewinella xylanilytica]PPK88151.1 putative transcriptional regulator [Neolewinella xylanilytica]